MSKTAYRICLFLVAVIIGWLLADILEPIRRSREVDPTNDPENSACIEAPLEP